jgi:hypothetical protein
MKQIQFDNLHKTLKDAVLEREGKEFMPDVVECRIIDSTVYDENLQPTGVNRIVEVYYGCGDFRGSIAPIKATKALEIWFNGL